MGSAARIRRQVAALGPRGRGARVPEGLREEIGAYARGRLEEGAGLREVAAETGVSPESVRRWAGSTPDEHRDVELLPVQVIGEAESIVLVAPGGYRIEGLDIAGAAALLRRLA
jgi:hypothetical protein